MTLSASDAALACPAGVVTRFAAAVPARAASGATAGSSVRLPCRAALGFSHSSAYCHHARAQCWVFRIFVCRGSRRSILQARSSEAHAVRDYVEVAT